MPAPHPTPAARPRWRGLAALAAAALLVGACTSGGGSSREDVIDTLTDEDLENPLSTEEAACAYDRLREELGDDLGDVTGGRSLDDGDDEVVTRVSQIVQACVNGSGPQPADDTESDESDTDSGDTTEDEE
jgi:hypothetical protein